MHFEKVHFEKIHFGSHTPNFFNPPARPIFLLNWTIPRKIISFFFPKVLDSKGHNSLWSGRSVTVESRHTDRVEIISCDIFCYRQPGLVQERVLTFLELPVRFSDPPFLVSKNSRIHICWIFTHNS